jgi:hypothetical protein
MRIRNIYFTGLHVPKTRQISEEIREEVLWKENFPVIRGNDDYFPRITGKFSLQGTFSSLPTKICQIFSKAWQAYIAHERVLNYRKINDGYVIPKV